MNKDIDLLIAEYDGFLNSIRCFLGYVRTYFAWFQETKDIDKSLNNYIKDIESSGGKNTACFDADYDHVKKIFHENIFSKLEEQGHQNVERVEWELFEYYGLASTAIDEDGPWNPIISGKSKVLTFNLEETVESTVIIVKIDKYLIFTVLINEKIKT